MAPEYLHYASLPSASLTPLAAPNSPDSPLTPYPLGSPWCHLYPYWPLCTYTPCQPPMHPDTSIPPDSLLTPLHPQRAPLMPPISKLAPEHLHSLPAPNAPLTPLHSLMDPSGTPTLPRSSSMPPDAANTPAGPWGHTLPASPQCTPASPLTPPPPLLVEASSGQQWYYCRSAWHPTENCYIRKPFTREGNYLVLAGEATQESPLF